MNHRLHKLLRNDATTLLGRLLLIYIAWFLCRVLFFLQNRAAIGPLAWSEIPSLAHGAWVFDTASILYVNALFIVLSLLPLRVRERGWYQKGLFWWFVATNFLALVVNVSDGVYFHYAHKRFTADELSYFSNNDNTATVTARALLENWYIVLAGLALMAGVVWCYRRLRYAPTRITGRWRYVGVNLVVFLLGIALVFGGIRGGFSRQTRPITLSNATLYTSSHLKANLILSNPFALLRTLGNKQLHYTKYYDQAILESLYTPYHFPTGEEPMIGEKRNVVIFILESFSSEHSALLNPDLYPNSPGHTPYLDSLMQQGYYFTNAYANGHKSIDALPSVFSSIPSYETPFVLLPQALAHMESLPWLLGAKGYHTAFFNGSSRGSMGFGAYATLAGVQEYVSREDFETAHGTDDFDGYWGIWDEPFLQFMNERLSQTQQPFFASVFTLTSHHPFVVPKAYQKRFTGGQTKVHPGVEYTDYAVRRFMEAASHEPWFRNTLFVFVADHVSSETFAPKTLTPTGNSHIITFLYTPDGALRGVDTCVTQQIDIMPTVLGLLGHREPYFAFGRDVLRESAHPAMAVNFMGENYQAITDSLVLFFDGTRPLAAYTREDTLQKNNLLGQPLPASEQGRIETLERDLKAHIQQYYQHVEQGSYVVPASAAQ